jgi:phosphohistidine swiveling domain-containing protein
VLVDLDDPAALDPLVAGAKAARLARARRLGLPALPGVVVAVETARSAVGAALGELPRGSGAARLAVLRVVVDPDLLDRLRQRVERLGFPVVVRSSSPLEDDPTWAGAFSSFLDIAADDLSKAIRGCWASAFAVDPLERAERAGVAPGDLAMAVLVQPQVTPDVGGLARTTEAGEVLVTAVKGSPAPLLAGWERGVQVNVDPADGVQPGDAGDVMPHVTVQAVARLARQVRSGMGDDVIEWALDGARLTLLQCRHTAPVERAESPVVPDGLDDPMALRLARLALRFPGDLGERVVLPWACARGWDAGATASGSEPGGRGSDWARGSGSEPGGRGSDWARGSGSEPGGRGSDWARGSGSEPGGRGSDWARGSGSEPAGAEFSRLLGEIERRAAHLTALAWGLPSDEARAAAAQTFAEARGPRPRAALRRLAHLDAVPADEAAEVLAMLEAVPQGATERGVVAAPARDVWEPFVYGAVRAHGERVEGVAAAPGIGAGRVATVTNPHNAQITGHRPVLVAPRPLPGLAPMLWGAAGLVTGTGSPAAHLLEVAHSLRVPAVVGCPLDERMAAVAGTGVIAAVDGAAGAVYFTTG